MMPCTGCGSPFEEAMKQFTVKDGDDEFHRTCWDKEVRLNGA